MCTRLSFSPLPFREPGYEARIVGGVILCTRRFAGGVYMCWVYTCRFAGGVISGYVHVDVGSYLGIYM